MSNPFGENQKKGSLVIMPFGTSTMLYNKERKSLFVTGDNHYGQLATGNTYYEDYFIKCMIKCNNPWNIYLSLIIIKF